MTKAIDKSYFIYASYQRSNVWKLRSAGVDRITAARPMNLDAHGTRLFSFSSDLASNRGKERKYQRWCISRAFCRSKSYIEKGLFNVIFITFATTLFLTYWRAISLPLLLIAMILVLCLYLRHRHHESIIHDMTAECSDAMNFNRHHWR